jgi:hypothetical protein
MPAEKRPTIADLRPSRSLREVRPHLSADENAQLSADLENGELWAAFQRWRAVADYRSNPANRQIVDEQVNRPPRPTLTTEEMAARLGVTLPAA